MAVFQDFANHIIDFWGLLADEFLIACGPGVGEFVEGEAQFGDRLRDALCWGEINAREGEDVAQLESP